MKKAASVFLRTEIYPEDIPLLIRWMENPHVTRYLNEDENIAASLRTLARSVPAPMLTWRFNQGGRFFLICQADDTPIGYIRLRTMQADAVEIVYVIGEESLWGNGYGKQALHAALSRAFLQKRVDKIVAKIHLENQRSIRSVCACGFRPVPQPGHLRHYRMTMDDYLERLRA